MSPSDKFLDNHPNLLAYTHNILSKRKYTFLFPRILEAHFVAKRALESQAFINTGRILLILLFLIIVANVTDVEFAPRDEDLHWGHLYRFHPQ